jgi:hypothetical protein
MEKELTLKEKFLLLCYQPESGNPYPATYYYFGYIGSALLELANMGKIKTEGKLLKLVDSKATGDHALDYLIEIMAKAGREKKTAYWIRKFSEYVIKRKLRLLILQELMSKRILFEKDARALLIFKYKKYPARETRTRNELIRSVQNLVLRNKESDKDAMMLAVLIGATRITGRFFEKKDRKQARQKIKILIKENKVASIVNETVASVEAAIMAAIIATTLVTTNTASR